jgi:hypothetical protein
MANTRISEEVAKQISRLGTKKITGFRLSCVVYSDVCVCGTGWGKNYSSTVGSRIWFTVELSGMNLQQT